MHVPYRLVAAARPTLPAGLLVALALGTANFAATPFLIPAIADALDIGVGTAGLISTAQLAGFMIGSWLAPRVLAPTSQVVVGSILALAVANGLSALVSSWPLLLALRVISGVGLGATAWLAWREAFGHRRRTNELNVAAPLVVMVSTPLVAVLASEVSAGATFAVLAVLALIPLALPIEPSSHLGPRPGGRRGPAATPALLMLLALGLLTTGGSSVFVFVAVIGTERADLTAMAVSVAIVVNAAMGLLASRVPRPEWASPAAITAIAASAALLTVTRSPVVFFVVVSLWGLLFFVALPSSFDLLSSRSRYPEERAGDAQAVMAAGRVAGPALGGALVSAGSLPVLGLVAAGILLVSAAVAASVARFHPPASVEPAPVDEPDAQWDRSEKRLR
ncbi:MAG: MFS transporter [Actinomycetota bacterium]